MTMTPHSLFDLAPRIRRQKVSGAILAALAGVASPMSTYELVDAIAAPLRTTTRKDKANLARLVVSLAPDFPDNAKRSSVSVRRYGKEMRPWVWSNALQVASLPDLWTIQPGDQYDG